MKIETFVLTHYQANCYLVSHEDNLIVIDPGGPSEELNNAIGDRKLDAILCTHAHPDHVQGVSALLKQQNVPFYLHPFGEDFLDTLAPDISKFLPIDVEQPFKIGAFTFNLMFTPGHSPDHVIFIHEDEKTIFVGDLVFAGSIGRVDLPGSNPADMMESLKTLLNLSQDYTLYSGHGPVTTLEQERQSNPFLLQLKN